MAASSPWPIASCRRSPCCSVSASSSPERPRLDELTLDLVRRHAPVELERQVDAGVGAEAEQADLVLQLRARRVVEVLAELVVERVARHGERLHHVDHAVLARAVEDVAPGVAEHAADGPGRALVELGDRLQRVRALVVVRRARAQPAGGQGGVGGEDLERRAHVVLALDRPVGQRRPVGIGLADAVRALGREDLLELGAVDAGREPAVVERRVARHRHDLPGLVVHDGRRTGRRLVVDARPDGEARIERAPSSRRRAW